MTDMSLEDPAAWRSAIDANSGRTYWYHRTTRQTTWKMPECLVEVQKTNEDNCAYKELIGMLDGLATPVELIDLLDKPPVETQFEVLKIIFNCCLPSTAAAWAQHSGFIDKLANIIIRTKSIDIRVLCLRILFGLAASPDTVQAFRVSKGWISLADMIENWNDANTAIIFSFFISLLCSGALKAYIPKALLDCLLSYLQSRCNDDAVVKDDELLIFIPHPNPRGSSLLSAELMGKLALRGQAAPDEESHLLPSFVFIVLVRYSFQSKTASLAFCKNGGLSVLQSLCSNINYPESIRSEAISLLRVAMKSSDYIQNSVLNSWIGLATDLSSTQEVAISRTAAAPSAVEISERDVELRSTVGKQSVKIHSAILWARCPGLRSIIEDLWVERRGSADEEINANNRGMEISLEASDAVLAALHQYILTGILSPLPLEGADNSSSKISDAALGADFLELSKVACELEMADLELAIARHICQLLYWSKAESVQGLEDIRNEEELEVDERNALQRLERCMSFAEKWGLTVLSKFLATVQYYMSVETSMVSGDYDEENNKSCMVLTDTCFTPMKFRRTTTTAPTDSPKRQSMFNDDFIMLPSPTRAAGNSHRNSRSREVNGSHGSSSVQDDLHEQVIASLEEVSFAISEGRNPRTTTTKQGQPASEHVRNVENKELQDDLALDSYLDAYKDQYISRGTKDSLMHQEPSIPRYTSTEGHPESSRNLKNPVAGKALRSSASKQPLVNDKKSSQGSRSSGVPPRKVSSAPLRKQKGHGGMYELLIAAGSNMASYEEYANEESVDPSIGDYSQLYSDQARGNSGYDKDTFDDNINNLENHSDSDYSDSLAQPAYMPSITPGKVPKGVPSRSIASSSGGKVNKPIPASIRLGQQQRGRLSEAQEVGVYEFDPKRDSLVGTPKLSATEKRLNELSQPKALREKIVKKKKTDMIEEGGVDSDKLRSSRENGHVTELVVDKGKDYPPPLPTPSSMDAVPNLPIPPVVDSKVRASLKLLKSKRRASITPTGLLECSASSVSVDHAEEVPSDVAAGPPRRKDESSRHAPFSKKVLPPDSIPRPSVAPSPVAPSNCTRSSGCTCAMCSMPIAPVTEPFTTSDSTWSVNEDERRALKVRETELQRKRKEANAKKVAKGKAADKPSTSDKWKLQSQQFRAAMRAARGVGTIEEESIPTVDENGVPFGMVHCDGCGRNFNPESGARHMKVCKDIKAKPKMLMRGGGKSSMNSGRR